MHVFLLKTEYHRNFDFSTPQEKFPAKEIPYRKVNFVEVMRMDYNGSRVIDIAATTNLSRPAVSQHLQILKDAGIVKMRKEGEMTYYDLGPDMSAFNHLIHTFQQSIDICTQLSNRTGEKQ